MNGKAKRAKIESLIFDEQLDGMLLGGLYNLQWATGVRIAPAHAQTDLPLFALFSAHDEPLIVIPDCWQDVARQESYYANIIAYGLDTPPVEAAAMLLKRHCAPGQRLGIDDADMAVATYQSLTQYLTGDVTLVPVSFQMARARAVKTAAEIDLLAEIALKTDHVINGHFHHLSADRPKTASSISESLRVHSSERDIELGGYHACARAVLGESISSIWAYAPLYGFAEAEMTTEHDAIIADVLACEGGYWSNATRIAVSSDHLTEEQEAAYDELNQLRGFLLDALLIGRRGADVYGEVVARGQKEGLALVKELPMGFGVGVSPREAPFLAPGERMEIAAGMVLVLDPMVRYGPRLYRSRDTVVIGPTGPTIVNWYKDWREPYIAILEL